jgi:hypothetical protein
MKLLMILQVQALSLAITVTVVLPSVVVAVGGHRQYDHYPLCRDCGRPLADPAYLLVDSLAPTPSLTDKLIGRNVTGLFGQPKVPLQRFRNPAGFEFDVVLFKKAACQSLDDVGHELERRILCNIFGHNM